MNTTTHNCNYFDSCQVQLIGMSALGIELPLSQPTLEPLRFIIVCLRQDYLATTVPLLAPHMVFKLINE